MRNNKSKPNLADQRNISVVYQPAEDSKLLANTAIDYLTGAPRVLDLGTGSGYVGSRLSEEIGANVVASDVNPHACESAAKAGLAVVRGHLCDPFPDAVFEAVVFNPPYLPTPPEHEWGDWMELALSGGESGREVIKPFITDLRRVLKPDGDAFVLVSSLTGIETVRDHARAHGLTTMVATEESHPNERLVVLHLVPS